MKRWFDARLEADVVLRALAISLVVYNHAFAVKGRPFELNGGMQVLLLLSGATFARFTLTKQTAEEVRASIVSLSINILGPCLAMLLPYFLLKRDFWWSEVLFFQNLVGKEQLAPYLSWYPQVIVQMMIGFFRIFAIPPVFRACCVQSGRRNPGGGGIQAIGTIASPDFIPPLRHRTMRHSY